MRRMAAAVLAWAFSATAFATTVTTDFTDLWWNPNESGWGANVAQQGDILFVTLFVYNGLHEPIWFVAPATKLESTFSDVPVAFSGPLYETRGTHFPDPWDLSQSSSSQVGTLRFVPRGAGEATLVYDVGGLVTTKLVQRQTWGFDSLVGTYFGARQGTWSGCGAGDGKVDTTATVFISQQGNDVQIRDAGPRHTCNYLGKYRQTGRMGEIVGNAICDDGVNRTFTGTEVQVAIQYFVMRVHMNSVGSTCAFDGYSGGIRQLP